MCQWVLADLTFAGPSSVVSQGLYNKSMHCLNINRLKLWTCFATSVSDNAYWPVVWRFWAFSRDVSSPPYSGPAEMIHGVVLCLEVSVVNL